MIRASLRRPVAITMAYTSIALLGVAAWRNIPIEMLPDAELPRLSINASWPGSSPETVEAFLTAPLEATVLYNPSMSASGIALARLIGQQRGMSDLVEVEVPASITTFSAVVTADNVDQYMQFGFS